MTSTDDHHWTDERNFFAEDPVFYVEELVSEAAVEEVAAAPTAVEQPETRAEMRERMFAALNRLGPDGGVPLRVPPTDDDFAPTVGSDRVVDAVIFDVRCHALG